MATKKLVLKDYERLLSAMAHIDSQPLYAQANAVARLGPDHRSWTVKGTLSVAKELGWTRLESRPKKRPK